MEPELQKLSNQPNNIEMSDMEKVPGTLSQEQMKGNLQDMMSKIDQKYQNLNSQKFVSSNKDSEGKNSMLRNIFDMLQLNGVDPSNVEEVRAFLEKLKQNNPEQAQQFESVLESLLGEEILDKGEISEDIGLVNSGIAPQDDQIMSDNMNMENNEVSQENL